MNNTVSAKSIIATLLLTFMILFAVSCNNSLTKILTGTWEMTEYRINSFDEHESVNVFWTFEKDGNFSQTIKYPGKEEHETATWTLEDPETLKINYQARKMEVKWKIVYLDKANLKVEHITPGFYVERSFKKQ
jgi:hypothetical protein